MDSLIKVRPPLNWSALHVKCPLCGASADLDDRWQRVTCKACGLDITYGEYILLLAQKDVTYRDVLQDYR